MIGKFGLSEWDDGRMPKGENRQRDIQKYLSVDTIQRWCVNSAGENSSILYLIWMH